jgi:TorA maturation chaperone TorD
VSNLFLTEPTVESLEKLRSVEFREALYASQFALDDCFFTEPLEEVSLELAVEYTSLFILPGKNRIPPYESIQTPGGSGVLSGPETHQVRAYITATGTKYNETLKELPDHFGIELYFMKTLAEIESTSWEKGDIASALNSLDFQNDFFKLHLGKWAFLFLGKVMETTTHNFYRELARFTQEFLSDEQSCIELLLERAREMDKQ